MFENIVVIKIGTGVLTRELDGTLDEASLVRLVTSVSELVAFVSVTHFSFYMFVCFNSF